MYVMLVLTILYCLYLLWHDEDKKYERMQKSISELNNHAKAYEVMAKQIKDIKSDIDKLQDR